MEIFKIIQLFLTFMNYFVWFWIIFSKMQIQIQESRNYTHCFSARIWLWESRSRWLLFSVVANTVECVRPGYQFVWLSARKLYLNREQVRWSACFIHKSRYLAFHPSASANILIETNFCAVDHTIFSFKPKRKKSRNNNLFWMKHNNVNSYFLNC